MYFREMKLLFASMMLLVSASSSLAQCPRMAVKGPDRVTNPGEKMEFEVSVAGSTSLTYQWTVSSGLIVSGQGTNKIIVATEGETWDGFNVTATVDVGGLPADCGNSASETAIVSRPPDWEWDQDAFGPLSSSEIRLRLDLFFTELMNNPTDTGLIVLRIRRGERRTVRNKRLQFILRHAKHRRFDKNRLWFALESTEMVRTIPVRIPPGASMPPCNNCVILRDADLK